MPAFLENASRYKLSIIHCYYGSITQRFHEVLYGPDDPEVQEVPTGTSDMVVRSLPLRPRSVRRDRFGR